jgi:hypothetical protein
MLKPVVLQINDHFHHELHTQAGFSSTKHGQHISQAFLSGHKTTAMLTLRILNPCQLYQAETDEQYPSMRMDHHDAAAPHSLKQNLNKYTFTSTCTVNIPK